MIHESQLSEASFEVRQRAKQTRAFERGDRVLVVPHDPVKVFRLVTFIGELIICVAYETGEPAKLMIIDSIAITRSRLRSARTLTRNGVRHWRERNEDQ